MEQNKQTVNQFTDKKNNTSLPYLVGEKDYKKGLIPSSGEKKVYGGFCKECRVPLHKSDRCSMCGELVCRLHSFSIIKYEKGDRIIRNKFKILSLSAGKLCFECNKKIGLIKR